MQGRSVNIPAHAALPGVCAAGGGWRGLVGPAVVGAFQVPNDLQKRIMTGQDKVVPADIENLSVSW